ncbi:hypothetical protein ACFQ0B_70370 [Nonomuraea thailandensis]
MVENCATVTTGDREQRTTDNRSCAGTLVKPAPAPSRTPRKAGRAEESEVAGDAGPEPAPATGKAAASSAASAADRNDVPPPSTTRSPSCP